MGHPRKLELNPKSGALPQVATARQRTGSEWAKIWSVAFPNRFGAVQPLVDEVGSKLAWLQKYQLTRV